MERPIIIRIAGLCLVAVLALRTAASAAVVKAIPGSVVRGLTAPLKSAPATRRFFG